MTDLAKSALEKALEFAELEVENRAGAGASMSDYENEAQEVVDLCRGALAALSRAPEASKNLQIYLGELASIGRERNSPRLLNLAEAIHHDIKSTLSILAKFVDFEDRYDADKSVSDEEVRSATAEAKALLEGKAP